MSFWERFYLLCKVNGTSPNGVCKDLGFSNAIATHWKNGKMPKGDTLKKIAEYFNVTADYLLTGEAEKETPLVRKDEERWKAIRDKVSALSEEDQDKLLDKLPKLIDLLTDQDQ